MSNRRGMTYLLANVKIPVFSLILALVILPILIWLLEINNSDFNFLGIYIAILSLHLPRDLIRYQISELLLTVSMVVTRLALLYIIMVPFFKVVNKLTEEAERKREEQKK